MGQMISERELTFLLYEVFETERLLERPRYAHYSRFEFDAIVGAAMRLATDYFAPHNHDGDACEPRFEAGAAKLIVQTGAAWKAFAEAGFLSAHWSVEEGGLGVPEVILRAALANLFAANVSTAGYPFLTIGAANLLRSFGSPEQKQRFLPAMGDGRSAGTMCLTEPGQGSALGDIRTQALVQPDGSYRIFGQKMFISGGDQDFTDNIVHMVLARIPGEPAGAKGISLFLVPKWLVNEDGARGARNDVALAGLLHKMGWHNTTSTVLSFGENGGAQGYLLGQKNHGLGHMFQLMNEALIVVLRSRWRMPGSVSKAACPRRRIRSHRRSDWSNMPMYAGCSLPRRRSLKGRWHCVCMPAHCLRTSIAIPMRRSASVPPCCWTCSPLWSNPGRPSMAAPVTIWPYRCWAGPVTHASIRSNNCTVINVSIRFMKGPKRYTALICWDARWPPRLAQVLNFSARQYPLTLSWRRPNRNYAGSLLR